MKTKDGLERKKTELIYKQFPWLSRLVDPALVEATRIKRIDETVIDLATIQKRYIHTGSMSMPVTSYTVRQRIFLLGERGDLVCDVGLEEKRMSSDLLYKANKYIRPDTHWGRLCTRLKMARRTVKESLERMENGTMAHCRIHFCVTYNAKQKLLTIYKEPKQDSLAGIFARIKQIEMENTAEELRQLEEIMKE